MTNEQEKLLTDSIKDIMLKLRNDSVVSGMKLVFAVVLDMCNKEKTDKEKIEEIRQYCDKCLNHQKE